MLSVVGAILRGAEGTQAEAYSGSTSAVRFRNSVLQVHVHGVQEPPSVLFQFPPDGFVFTDPNNVNVALLVTYFAFHRQVLMGADI